MWALPNIKKMNKEAEKEVDRYEIIDGKVWDTRNKCYATCEYCELKEATGLFEWYDIFSDTPHYEPICEECLDNGATSEGYFYCEGCDRTFITNYTWENYYTDRGDGTLLCLNCYAREVLKNPDNWLASEKDVKTLTFENIRKACHIWGVENNRHKKYNLKEIGYITIDGSSGGKVVGFTSSTTPEDSLQGIKNLLLEGLKDYKEVGFFLTGSYQFAVDITIYGKDNKTGK